MTNEEDLALLLAMTDEELAAELNRRKIPVKEFKLAVEIFRIAAEENIK